MTLIKIAFALLLVVSSSALAEDAEIKGADFGAKVVSLPTYQRLQLAGNLNHKDRKAIMPILDSLEPSKPILFILNFGGGTSEIIKPFAEALRARALELHSSIVTVIPPDKVCASYCMLLYMVGERRLAFLNSHFGFHTATVYAGLIKVSVSKAATEEYAKAGVSRSWLRENLSYFKSREVTWRNPDALGGSNIVTDVVNGLPAVEAILAAPAAVLAPATVQP